MSGLDGRRIIDISLPMDKSFTMATPPGFKKALTYETEVLKEYDAPGGAGQIVRGVHMRLHAGTHVDAPIHFVQGGTWLHELPLEVFVGEALVADLTPIEPNSGITAEALERAIGGRMRRGERLLVRTDWNQRYREPDWREGSPYFTPQAVEWLLERDPRLMGVDFLHAKDGPDSPCKEYTLRACLEQGVVLMAYLTNLDQVSRERVTLIALPLAFKDVEASPVRAVVIEE